MRVVHLLVMALVVALQVGLGPSVALGAERSDAAVERRAEAIATEAKMLFQQKLFETAAERFMEAYTLVRRPTLIYNAARAYEQAGKSQKALAMFRAYRDLAEVQADGKADADLHIHRLEADLKAQEAAAKSQEAEEQRARHARLPEPAEVEPPVETPPAHAEVPAPAVPPKPAIPLWPAGTAVGLAVVSGALFVLAKDQESQARDIESAGFRTPAHKADYLDHASNAKGLQAGAIVGAALTAGALGWLAWELYSARQAEPKPGPLADQPAKAARLLELRLLPAAGGTGVSLDVRF